MNSFVCIVQGCGRRWERMKEQKNGKRNNYWVCGQKRIRQGHFSLPLHCRALLRIRSRHSRRSRRSNSSGHLCEVLWVVESQHLDPVDRIEVAIPLAQKFDVLGTGEVGDFYNRQKSRTMVSN